MKTSKRKHWLCAGVSMLVLATTAISASAQDSLTSDKSGKPDKQDATASDKKAVVAKSNKAADEPVIIITARRKALRDAIEIKKNSDTIVDSVVADQDAQLPDTSITEVLQRVSGVTLSRFSTTSGGTPSFQIEGTGVSVRGLPYNASTLNGRQVFSANGASGIQWQEVTPELGAGVDVYKASRADLIEGGTSSINLRSRLPFDYKKPTIDMSFGASYGDQIKKASPNISALVTKRFDSKIGEIGFLVDLAYSKYYSEDSDAQMGAYLAENDPNRDSSPGANDGWALVPTGYSWSQSSHERERTGFYTATQWKPNDDFTFTSTFFYSKYHNNDLSYGGGWGNSPSATYENIPTDATFDANGGMTAGSLYVGATGGATPIFGWGGNNWLYQYLPKGDPAYEWIWGESWSPDAGHDASNTLLTADCRTPYGALTSSTPNINWGKWAQPGMFYCQDATNANSVIGLNLGGNASASRNTSETTDFSNSFVWTPNESMRVRGALQYVRSAAKGIGLFTSIIQSDPNLSSASFDVSSSVPKLGGFDATALANTDTAYFGSMGYTGSDNLGSMLAANIDVDYAFDDSHFIKSISFGARIAGRKERDTFVGSYWAPVSEDWVTYVDPTSVVTGDKAIQSPGRPYLSGPHAITGPYDAKDTFSVYVTDANGNRVQNSDGSYQTKNVTEPIHVVPYDTVNAADYQLYNFPNFFGGNSPSPGAVLLPSAALVQGMNWQNLAGVGADAMSDAVNAARCAADKNAVVCDSHPGQWTPQTYYNSHLNNLGPIHSIANNQAVYIEAKFGSNGFWFVPSFTGNMGLRYVVNDLQSDGYFQVGTAKAFYTSDVCAYAARADYMAGGKGVPPAMLNCHQYAVPESKESRTATYSYARLLPSFNVKFDLPSHLILRLAGSQNMTMPNLNDIKAGGTVTPNLVNVPTPAAAGNSNPAPDINYLYTMTSNTGADRKPVMFTSGDVSLEWYPKSGAYAYLDVFAKELRNQDLYTSFYQTHATPLIDTATQEAVNVELPWFYQTNLSAHKAAEINGFEMGGRTFFDFLPKPFDGFGVSGSVTYVSSRNPAVLANSVVGPYVPDNSGKTNNNGPVPGNPNTDFKTIPYFGMAKWSYNVELYYSKGAFSTRLAYNWHDKQLLSTNANPLSYNATGGNPYICTACLDNGLNGQIWEMAPLWSSAAGYLDWSADYKINDHIALGVSAGNLTNTISKTMQEPLPGVFERLDTFVADQRINFWLRMHY